MPKSTQQPNPREEFEKAIAEAKEVKKAQDSAVDYFIRYDGQKFIKNSKGQFQSELYINDHLYPSFTEERLLQDWPIIKPVYKVSGREAINRYRLNTKKQLEKAGL